MYLGDMINISSLIWAAGELLRMHTYQLLSTVSDELVAADSHDESSDHCLYSRHPLNMKKPEQTRVTVLHDNHFSYFFFLNETARYEKNRSFITLMVDKSLFMCAETDSSWYNSRSVWKRCENT